jgi:RNA polymerase sigma-70 factor (ECF subfamily)
MSGTANVGAGTRPPSAATAEEQQLIASLRAGDEAAFETLIERYGGSLLRLAQMYVPSRAVAEDVVQETWIGVLKGLDKFEGRSSLKTWIFHILLNRARTRGRREDRSVPFSSLWDPESESGEPSVEPQWFKDDGWWGVHPRDWSAVPEERLLSQETRALIQQAIDALPPSQREVITLRDVDGWSSEEVCNALNISETNQRVLLHRARSKVRQAIEQYLSGA